MPKQIVLAVVTFLHDLFTAVWIGGLITLGLTVLPSARAAMGAGPATRKLLDTIGRRHSALVYISMAGLVVTGLLLGQASPAFRGLFAFAGPYSTALSLKHILVVAMIAIALYRSLVLGRRSAPLGRSQEKLSMALLLLNMVLGVLVLLLSGFAAAFSAPRLPG